MTISDWILLATALIVLWYSFETHKMRRALTSQLEGLRKTTLLSAYTSLFQINIRIIEHDHGDELARQMDHYKRAISKVGETVAGIERIVDELEKGA